MDQAIVTRLEESAAALAALEKELSSAVEPARYAELGRRHSELAPIVALFGRWKRAEQDRVEAEQSAAADPELAGEFRKLASEKEAEAEAAEAELRALLVPRDPRDVKDVIVEVRSAAGGDEAAIWAGDLLRMYERYADRHGFKVEPLDSSPSEAGGYDKVTVA
ncbi:MAG TPA: PCRF domain-containing protein, partial [Acidimicrobiia bacterium]|nr:PCRF domain-containing protein [Acidimicrobiia bacterium]